MRILIAILLGMTCLCTSAFAGEFGGWILEQLKAHPGFVELTEDNVNSFFYMRPGSTYARERWIGYILDAGTGENTFCYMIEEHGAVSTRVPVSEDEAYIFGEFVPRWAYDSIQKLFDAGVIDRGYE